MTVVAGSQHFGRGTVIVGVVLLVLSFVYIIQIAGVVDETREVLRTPPPEQPAGAGLELDVRTFAIHDFFFTSQAWGLAHIWLLWVVGVGFLRRPQRRVRMVESVIVALAIVIGATWAMALWLAGHGTRV